MTTEKTEQIKLPDIKNVPLVVDMAQRHDTPAKTALEAQTSVPPGKVTKDAIVFGDSAKDKVSPLVEQFGKKVDAGDPATSKTRGLPGAKDTWALIQVKKRRICQAKSTRPIAHQ